MLVVESDDPETTNAAGSMAQVVRNNLTQTSRRSHQLPKPTEALLSDINGFLAEKKGTTTISTNIILEDEDGYIDITKRTHPYYTVSEDGTAEASLEVETIDISVVDYATMLEYHFSQEPDGSYELEKRNQAPANNLRPHNSLFGDNEEGYDLDEIAYDEALSAGLYFPEQQDVNFMNQQIQKHLNQQIEQSLQDILDSEK
jgi:hypothetical protein